MLICSFEQLVEHIGYINILLCEAFSVLCLRLQQQLHVLVCCGRVTLGAAVNQVDFVAHLGFLCMGRNHCSHFIETLE